MVTGLTGILVDVLGYANSGYPLELTDSIQEITKARNIELGLGLQFLFLLSDFIIHRMAAYLKIDAKIVLP
ncbi:hypothetical protein K1719_017983 [Acacia pycnantha]|nr:hypothetical protein K1719_017983 [Acacia pycnantha]